MEEKTVEKQEMKKEEMKKEETTGGNGFGKKELEDGKTMAILSYILPFIPYFAEKENKRVRFHAVQGMNLLIVAVALNIVTNILYSISWRLWGIVGTISMIVNLGITALCIIGIVNVCKEQAKELPIIDKIKIIKK